MAAREVEGAGPVRHVLVADDEPHIGRIIKMKLEQGPFEVTLVYDGDELLGITPAMIRVTEGEKRTFRLEQAGYNSATIDDYCIQNKARPLRGRDHPQ